MNGVHAGHRCRVFCGSEELRYVRGVDIHCPIDGLVTLTLEIIGGFSYEPDGTFRLEAMPKPTAALPDRGIALGGVPQP